MAKTPQIRTLEYLLTRKTILLRQIQIPTDLVRASLVRQFVTCGKPNCRCRRGLKHGPFEYLVRCDGVGKIRKFLLKTDRQKKQARGAVAAYTEFQQSLEELSQINTELLRRGEGLAH